SGTATKTFTALFLSKLEVTDVTVNWPGLVGGQLRRLLTAAEAALRPKQTLCALRLKTRIRPLWASMVCLMIVMASMSERMRAYLMMDCPCCCLRCCLLFIKTHLRHRRTVIGGSVAEVNCLSLY